MTKINSTEVDWLRKHGAQLDPDGKYDGPSFQLGILAELVTCLLNGGASERRSLAAAIKGEAK